MRELDGRPGLVEADGFALGKSMGIAHSMTLVIKSMQSNQPSKQCLAFSFRSSLNMIDLRGEAHFRKCSLLQRSIFSAPLFLNFGMHHVDLSLYPLATLKMGYFSLKKAVKDEPSAAVMVTL